MLEARIQNVREQLRKFVLERDWQQFHSPKNLAMALTAEVGELVEHFQWLTDEESRSLSEADLQRVREELADVQIYVMLLADSLSADLLSEIERKIEKNRAHYPIESSRGTHKRPPRT